MVLDLKRIFAGDNVPLQIECELDMSSLEFSGYFPLKNPVTVRGNISNRASVVLLNLEIKYSYEAPCDRCGEAVSKPHTVKVEKVLATSIEGEESDTIVTVPDMTFDVDEFVYSEVVLDVPSKHLCKDTCKGVCSVCGVNLNYGECQCEKKEVDPRLSKLLDLLNN